jgi:hypothetical protein
MVALIIALPFMGAAFAAGDNDQDLVDDRQPGQKLRRFLLAQELRQRRQRRGTWFFKGAVKDTLGEVTIKETYGNIIIVQDGQDLLNVIMPVRWYDEAGEVVVLLQGMFVEIEGSTVTMKVLERTATNEEGVSITIYFCYELNGYHAVLLYNISDDE